MSKFFVVTYLVLSVLSMPISQRSLKRLKLVDKNKYNLNQFSLKVNSDGMRTFLKQCPSIETFTIHEIFRLTNDIIRLIFANLNRLKHFRIYNEFEEQGTDCKDRPWLELTKGCTKLQVR